MKNIDKIFEEFINNQSASSKNVYRGVIDKFRIFLENRGLNANNVHDRLYEISSVEILEFLDDCFNKQEIETQSVANRYASIVSSFLEYLTEKNLVNKELLAMRARKKGYDSFQDTIKNKIMHDNRLKPPVKNQPLDDDDIEIIKTNCVQKCDKIFIKYENDVEQINSIDFNSLCTYVRLYLMCCIGIGPTKMNTLTVDDILIEDRKIRFTKFDIFTPSDLCRLLQKYLEFRRIIKTESRTFFVSYNGKEFKNNNSELNRRIKEFIEGAKTSGITKNFVVKMIDNRLSPVEIEDITDSKGNNYKDCAKLVYDRKKESEYISNVLFNNLKQ